MFTVLYSGSVLHCTVYLSIQIHIAHYYVHYCTYCSFIQLNEQKYIFLINIMYCSITSTAQLNVRVYILHMYCIAPTFVQLKVRLYNYIYTGISLCTVHYSTVPSSVQLNAVHLLPPPPLPLLLYQGPRTWHSCPT